MKDLEEIALGERDRLAVEAAADMLRQRFPVEKVILYGSKARGDADEDSDIDLLIVTSRAIHWSERKAMIDALYAIEMAYDAIISILVITMSDWSEGIFTAFPLYSEIIRDGALAL